MSTETIHLSEELAAHVREVSVHRESDVLRRLREETARHPRAIMQISPEQGQLMAFLVRALGVTQAIEIGVFTGYSALCVAEALPADGRLVACDVSEEYTALAKPFWEEAGVADRIDLRIAPAADTLAALLDGGEAGTFGFAFIDADKTGNDGYYEQCLTLLHPGGVIAVDNMFLEGRVVSPEPEDESARAVAAFTEKVAKDPRVDASLVPISDGLMLAKKR